MIPASAKLKPAESDQEIPNSIYKLNIFSRSACNRVWEVDPSESAWQIARARANMYFPSATRDISSKHKENCKQWTSTSYQHAEASKRHKA